VHDRILAGVLRKRRLDLHHSSTRRLPPLYMLGDHPVANVSDRSAVVAVLFLDRDLATVGYGDMHPRTNYGHLVATVEIFTGMSFLAVMPA